jgi:choline/glycine/proline betaine transport protein
MQNIKNKYFDISIPVFFPAAIITIIFVTFTIIFDQQAETYFTDFRSFMSKNLGWFVNIAINYFLFFVVYLAVNKLGKIKIGGANAKPDFSKFSWVAMLFSAGMGIGLVYFSVAEPMLNFANPIESDLTGLEKSKLAMKHTFLHYGFHVWAIYALLGIALAYFTFNKNEPLSIKSTLKPLFGKWMTSGIGYGIDVVAVLATLFGLATTLGFGAVQFSSGVSLLTGTSNDVTLQILSIVGITLIATTSVLSGLNKGLKYLSNLNIILACILFVFILIIGSTAYLLDGFVENLGLYLRDLFQLSTFRNQYADEGQWLKGWSMFYWLWWISWSPFVGTFIARISKGRTIREIAIYGLLVPTLFSLLWMSVFGGTALGMQLEGTIDLAQIVSEDSSLALFKMLEELPFYEITATLCIFLVATFFITSSDSGSLVVDFMTSGGKLDAPKGQKVFWAFMEGAIAIALLVGGGLSALQSASISTGLPFAVILIFVSLSLRKTLKNDKQLNTDHSLESSPTDQKL